MEVGVPTVSRGLQVRWHCVTRSTNQQLPYHLLFPLNYMKEGKLGRRARGKGNAPETHSAGISALSIFPAGVQLDKKQGHERTKDRRTKHSTHTLAGASQNICSSLQLPHFKFYHVGDAKKGQACQYFIVSYSCQSFKT